MNTCIHQYQFGASQEYHEKTIPEKTGTLRFDMPDLNTQNQHVRMLNVEFTLYALSGLEANNRAAPQ